MKSRRIALEIDLIELKNFDAFDLGEVLQSLPEDTKVVSFGAEMNRAVLSILLENEKFKEINDWQTYPRVTTKENEDETLSTTINDEMLEPVKTLSYSFVDDVYFINPIYTLPKDGLYSIGRDMVEWKGADDAFDVKFKNTHNHCKDLLNLISEKRSVKVVGKNLPVEEKKVCSHSWVPYEGLTEAYNFCALCDEKKKQ